MPKYKTFQVCINIFIYHYYGETRIYRINNSLVQFILASACNITSILLGIWKIPAISTIGNVNYVFKALKTNINGGNDYTTVIEESKFSHRVNYIWRNLPKEVRTKLDRTNLAIILEVQDIFITLEEPLFEEQNLQYLNSKLNRGGVKKYEKCDLKSVLEICEKYYPQKNLTLSRP